MINDIGSKTAATAEGQRLAENAGNPLGWRRWGPYVSERSWGTVREDYSSDGNAWQFLPHAHARYKAYRWGEDGLAAICDRYQLLVLGFAFWNGRDEILKERAFGLTPLEGNHGEDVKEYYFYLDSTPTHSYMKYLYKYPQARYPYRRLVEENQRRGGRGFEYELMDTGVFEGDRYFDIFIEYAKSSQEDLCIRVEVFNRSPEAAELHILPQLWFRNTWCWTKPPASEPVITLAPSPEGTMCLIADDSNTPPLPNLPFQYRLGQRFLYGELQADPLFTNNESNREVLYRVPNLTPYVKDAFHRAVVDHDHNAVNPNHFGTKGCLHARRWVPGKGSVVLRYRFTPDRLEAPLEQIDEIVSHRRAEAGDFYNAIHPARATPDERRVQRQAFAGLLWSKQIYLFDVDRWLEGDNPSAPPPTSRSTIRNSHWRHLNSMRVLSMPDKWEYPWFAAWDLAFHMVPFSLLDPEFAKEQLWLMLFEQFQHPNGQIPAYEWEFSDLNPPVHAWAVWRVYNQEKIRYGRADREWLEKCFHKLLINFAWWVNKVDGEGNNVFEGGFLGLDNITVIDRSEKLPHGAVLQQSDATGWMGMFCLNLMRIALELSSENRAYESLATKFFQHYIYIGAAMMNMGGQKYSLWDEQDGFFYDVLRFPDGSFHKFRVRSLVGLIPLFAVERLEVNQMRAFPEFFRNFEWFVKNRRKLTERCCHYIERDGQQTYELTVVDESQLRRMLARVFDPAEFLSDYGIRSLSKAHQENPFVFGSGEVRYDPAESDNKIKGGNSNWRGPIWFPTSFLIIESLRKLGRGFESYLKIEIPGDPAGARDLTDLAGEVANRLIGIFTANADGHRPVYGGLKKFQEDPLWKDYVLFHEYFHGDNGAGVGASHQTGWTALVASLIDEWRQ